LLKVQLQLLGAKEGATIEVGEVQMIDVTHDVLEEEVAEKSVLDKSMNKKSLAFVE
jgi:hypothetical protein